MDIAAALDFARSHRNGVLTTVKRDGRPQLSNIVYAVGDDGALRISITGDRAKYFNLVRDPRASVHISRDDFWAYVVLEGDAALMPIAAAPDDATVDALVALYRSFDREHDDWDEYRAAMVRDKRTVLTITPANAYGMLPS